MASILSIPCSECVNTYWQKVLEQGQWLYRCTNCWKTRPVIERNPKGFWMATAEGTFENYLLTDKGWLTYSEMKKKKAKMFWKRKSKNYRFWINNPPTSGEVKETYTEF